MVKFISLLLMMWLTGCGSNTTTPGQTIYLTDPVPPAWEGVCNIQSSKKLLIIGDSISMGYTPYLRTDLCGFYNVSRVSFPDGTDQNGQGTVFTLTNLDRWLAQVGPVDVITWNDGLWDAYDPTYDSTDATDLATYQANLITIATKLKATGARVLFFTTTDIPASGYDPATGQTLIPGRDLSENSVALSVLPGLGVEVYDLNAIARSNPKLHLSNDPIHFDAQGYVIFAQYIYGMVTANYEWSN